MIPAERTRGLENPSLIWTGKELVVSGAVSVCCWHGEAYNPRTDKWRSIADPPTVPDRYLVWTGEELISWSSGQAYDPARDRWRSIPPAPVTAAPETRAVWTGRELVVLGAIAECPPNADCSTLPNAAAAYDPKTDTWRRLPDLPRAPEGGVSVAWNGVAVVVAWATCCGGATFAYSPEADTWREIAAPPPEVANGEIARTGRGLVGVGMGSGLWIGAFQLRDGWRPIVEKRPVVYVCQVRATVVPGGEFVTCPQPALYLDLQKRVWHSLPQPPVLVGATVWTGRELLALSVDGMHLLRYRPGR
jgi:hypothetical protein